jgi:hypothetical protein
VGTREGPWSEPRRSHGVQGAGEARVERNFESTAGNTVERISRKKNKMPARVEVVEKIQLEIP